MLAGCAGNRFQVQRYVVNSGDTLDFIAWKYQIDVEDLAKWNRLSPPYTIHPGNRLVIFPLDEEHRANYVPSNNSNTANTRGYITVQKGDTLYGLSKRHGVSVSSLKQLNGLRAPYTVYVGQKLRLSTSVARFNTRHSSKPKSKGISKPSRTSTRISSTTIAPPNRWLWPTKGTVVSHFKGRKSTQKGIDIVGKLGQDIKASAAGKVVYSGQGIPTYGHLVLIRHNQNYMSAYAYNKKLLVKEGQTVKSGQVIAKMGRHSMGKPKLHFEIRKNGKPVNPKTFLPKKE